MGTVQVVVKLQLVVAAAAWSVPLPQQCQWRCQLEYTIGLGSRSLHYCASATVAEMG
jgi:hypothetical protein